MRKAVRLTSILTLLMLCGAPVAAAPPDELTPPSAEAQERLAQAGRALEAGDWRGAETVLQLALERWPASLDFHLLWLDAPLRRERPALTLARWQRLPEALRVAPAARWRAAQAYFALGNLLGKAGVHSIPGGREGQFVGSRLLVEARPGADSFLCCGPDSAMYQVRQALDGTLSGSERLNAQVLYARIWQELGRPEIALAVLENEAALLHSAGHAAGLATLGELALQVGRVDQMLHCVRLNAELQPQRRDQLLWNGCREVARLYNQRGDVDLHLAWLSRALELRPDDADAQLQVADAEWFAGRRDAAAAGYQRLLQLRPDHPRRAEILSRLADYAADGSR